MFLYTSTTIDVLNNDEKIVSILTSTLAKKYKVIGIYCEKVENLYLVAYYEKEKIIDIDSKLLESHQGYIPLELEVSVGESLFIGYRNKTGSDRTGDDIGIIYEVVG